MEHQSFSDFDAWKQHQAQVTARTQITLESITEAVLAEVVIPTLPENMQNIFCALVAGQGNPIRKLEVLQCFVYQHGLRHRGEIEHGRALVGVRGMTS